MDLLINIIVCVKDSVAITAATRLIRIIQIKYWQFMRGLGKNRYKVCSLVFVVVLLFSGFLRLGISDGLDTLRYERISRECRLVFVGNWQYQEKQIAIDGIEQIARKLANTTTKRDTPCEAFRNVFGINTKEPMQLHHLKTGDVGGKCFSSHVVGIFGLFPLYKPMAKTKSEHLIVHEFGHAFEARLEDVMGTKIPRNLLLKVQYHNPNFPDRILDPETGIVPNKDYGFAGVRWLWQLSADPSPGEEFADMFLGWAYDAWADNPAGRLRSDFMDAHMPDWINYLDIHRVKGAS